MAWHPHTLAVQIQGLVRDMVNECYAQDEIMESLKEKITPAMDIPVVLVDVFPSRDVICPSCTMILVSTSRKDAGEFRVYYS